MLRAFVRNRASQVVVVALVCLMPSPWCAADDYGFLCIGHADGCRQSATHTLGPPRDFEEDRDDSHACSCFICTVALGESFSPEIVSLPSLALLPPAVVPARDSQHVPPIYRPPIA